MTPSMHDRVKNMFVDAGLTTGFTVQTLLWADTGKLNEAFMVFRPNGGTAIRNDLGSDYYVLVDVIGAKGVGKNPVTDAAAQAILDYVQANPVADECVGKIENVGGKPAPLLSEEGRLIYRLQFACIYGD